MFAVYREDGHVQCHVNYGSLTDNNQYTQMDLATK